MSYSGTDGPIVEWFGAHARSIGIEPYLYEYDPRPGFYISEKVKSEIKARDALVAFLTANSQDSAYLQQEIGFAEGRNKLIIPIVEPGVHSLAMLTGREYIEFNSTNPEVALQTLLYYLDRLHVLKRQQDWFT